MDNRHEFGVLWDMDGVLVDTGEDNLRALSFFRKLGFGNELRHIYLSWNLDDHPDVIQKRETGDDEEA